VTSSTPPDTGSATIDAILRAAHAVRIATDSALRAQGLSLSSYKLLRALAAGSVSMRELSDALSVAPRTVTDLVDGLERHGFVTRVAHPRDRRICLIEITPDGAAELERARRVAGAVHEAAIADLSAEEREHLAELLARVRPGAPVAARAPAAGA
jgi:DNA-binding MarR family transcriptional regulator